MTHLQPNVRDVFEEAFELKTPQERLAYLDEACAGCPEVRARVEVLLGVHDEADTFLAEATDDARTLAPNEASQGIPALASQPDTMPEHQIVDGEGPLPTIPGYHLLDVLGRGGMGVVYRARQIGLNRLVALKMILSGAHAGAENRRRFLTEAEAVARLRHPNIVQIHEIGEHDGQPYFSLEYCAGGNLASKLNGTPLPALEAAQLVRTLARAVQAAHEAGVIHRDLKPANVLFAACGLAVDMSEISKPQAAATLKITDFGLAKKLDEVGQTASGAVMGTPSYMAPEQAEGSKETGPAADIYALGTILYECLTGRPPFRAATSLETIVMVVGNEPVPPTRLAAKVPRDLETICLKCLQKAPGKRYATAADLAGDLDRFLKGEPIQARPVSRVERTWRWCRRKPLVASLLALIALVALTGAGTVLHQLDRAVTAEGNLQDQAVDLQTALGEKTEAEKKARKKATDLLEANKELDKAYKELEAALAEVKKQTKAAEDNWNRAERKIYASNIALAQAAWQDHDVRLALRHLESCRKEYRGWEYDYLWNLFTQPTFKEKSGAAIGLVVYSPDQKWIACKIAQDVVKVLDASNGKEIHRFRAHGSDKIRGEVWSFAFSPDSKQLVSGGEDKTVKFWDVLTGKEIRTFLGHTAMVACVAFGAGGKEILSVSRDKTVRVWDPLTGEGKVKKLHYDDQGYIVGHPFYQAAFSQDGKKLATADSNGEVSVWDTARGEKQRLIKRNPNLNRIRSVALSADGKRGVTSEHLAWDKIQHVVWDALTGEAIATIKDADLYGGRHLGSAPNQLVAFNFDGKQVVSGSSDGLVMVWDASTGQEILALQGHTDQVNSVAFRPDGKQIASSGQDGVKLWDAVHGQKPPTFRTGRYYSRDGKLAVSDAGNDHTLQVRDTATGQVISTFKGHAAPVQRVEFSPDQKWVVSTDNGFRGPGEPTGLPRVRLWNAATGQEIRTVKEGWFVAFSPDSKWIAVTYTTGIGHKSRNVLKICDLASGQEVQTLPLGKYAAMAFSPDGKRIVLNAGDGPGLQLYDYDIATGQEIRAFKRHAGLFLVLAFSPDGKRIVGGSGFDKHPRELQVWDAETGQKVLDLIGHMEPVTCVAFSPDGKRIVSGSGDRTVRVWDAESGQETITLKGYLGMGGWISSVNFSPDGRRILSTEIDRPGRIGELKVWDALVGPGVK